jgi:hypothetical protein
VAKAEQEQVRVVLNRLSWRDAELLVLRNSGLSYGEIANSLHFETVIRRQMVESAKMKTIFHFAIAIIFAVTSTPANRAPVRIVRRIHTSLSPLHCY